MKTLQHIIDLLIDLTGFRAKITDVLDIFQVHRSNPVLITKYFGCACVLAPPMSSSKLHIFWTEQALRMT